MILPNQITIADIEHFLNRLAANKDWLYIIQPCGIGDVLFSGGLSYAIQQRKGKTATVMVLKDRMKNLGLGWDNVAQIIYLPNNTMETLRQGYFYRTQKYETDNYIYGHLKSINNELVFDRRLNAIDVYRNDVFNIPMNSPITPPVLVYLLQKILLICIVNTCSIKIVQ